MGKEKRAYNRPLTEKQERFCQYYLDTGNAAEAYRMAYDTSTMADDTIYRKAAELKSDGKITARLNEIRRQRAEETKDMRAVVQQAMLDIILAETSDLYIQDPVTGKIKMKTPLQLPKRTRNAIKRITNNKGTVSYEFHGKVEAARLLGSWNGWDAPQEINYRNLGLKIDGIDFELPPCDEDDEWNDKM